HVLALRIAFFFTHPSTTEIYTLSLHDALPISHARDPRRGEAALLLPLGRLPGCAARARDPAPQGAQGGRGALQGSRGLRAAPERSEEHTSELQSRFDLVCRLLLEKKKKNRTEKDTLPIYIDLAQKDGGKIALGGKSPTHPHARTSARKSTRLNSSHRSTR